jgi:hypothetical protein
MYDIKNHDLIDGMDDDEAGEKIKSWIERG